jgi:hypothetical protein
MTLEFLYCEGETYEWGTFEKKYLGLGKGSDKYLDKMHNEELYGT